MRHKGIDTMADTVDVFEIFYSELITVVPMIINELVIKLYSANLLSRHHKNSIDSLAVGAEKTQYLLEKVIYPGLKNGYTKYFDEMLKIMESSDDALVKYLADKIHKFSTSSSMPSVDQTPATQSEGNYVCSHCIVVAV